MQHDLTWKPSSWRSYKALQQPVYDDENELSEVLERIRNAPPLVGYNDILELKSRLHQASLGKVFIIQGGDCAERFEDASDLAIHRKLELFAGIAQFFSTIQKPLLFIGRWAGQYTKPRSFEFELHNGMNVPIFRGENIHGFKPHARTPKPERLWTGYQCAGKTIRIIQKKLSKDFTFTNKIFTSHEGLLLPYEEALTRYNGDTAFLASSHMIWIGDRTRFLDSAHVEYCRGIINPVGIKVGSGANLDELEEIIVRLRPTPGRIVLIPRLGVENIERDLPRLIKRLHKHNISWLCDPMHGNTVLSPQGLKTRFFDHIVEEVSLSFAIHSAEKSQLNGLHLEMTPDLVSECVGGRADVKLADLPSHYQTYCDPRLNFQQSLELAERFSSYH